MEKFLFALMIIFPAIAFGGSGDMVGIGYLAKNDRMKIYSRSEGEEIDATIKKDFPMVAFEGANILVGALASESIANGRVHVRYWKNGYNADDGENTAWVELSEVERFSFDCCGDPRCSGIKAPFFKTRSYTDCFTQAMTATIEKRAAAASSAAELEKLKLQLEIEKLKLEQERLKLPEKTRRAAETE